MDVGFGSGSGLGFSLLLLLLVVVVVLVVEFEPSLFAFSLPSTRLPLPSFSFLVASPCTGATRGLACQDRKQYHAVHAANPINSNKKERIPKGRSN